MKYTIKDSPTERGGNIVKKDLLIAEGEAALTDVAGCGLSKEAMVQQQQAVLQSQVQSTQSRYLCIDGSYESFLNAFKIGFAMKTSSNESILLESLCGRPKNEIREVVVTLSHLNAIRRAMATHPPPPPITTTSSTTSSTTTSSSVDLADYALIMEDDFYFAYEVNFHALISLAPPDFVVLQLVTSNDYSVLNLWRVFERRKRLFVRRKDHDDYWCAGGYLIHIERLRQIVDGVLYRAAGGGGDHQQQFHAKVMAGYERPCMPKQCCDQNGHFLASPLRQGCILSPRGYTADHVIFTLSKETYMLTVPILLNAPHGNMSTVHSEHVTFHQPAFHRMRQLTDKMAHELPSSHPALYAMLRQVINFQ
eukprot:gene5953-6555_t